MKQKNSSSDVITRDFLLKTFERFTRAFRNEVKFVIDEAIDNHEKRESEISDKHLIKLDFIVKELEKFRQDRIVGAHQTGELRVQVENHEKRIVRLERKQHAA